MVDLSCRTTEANTIPIVSFMLCFIIINPFIKKNLLYSPHPFSHSPFFIVEFNVTVLAIQRSESESVHIHFRAGVCVGKAQELLEQLSRPVVELLQVSELFLEFDPRKMTLVSGSIFLRS